MILLVLYIIGLMISCEVETISSYVREEKLHKIEECEYNRDIESGLLFHYLHSKDKGIQIASIKALGRMGDPRAVPYLANKLRSGDEEIIINTIIALGLIGEKKSGEEIVPYLYSSKEVTIAAVEALGLMKSELLIGKVDDLLSRGEPEIIEALAYAIANIGDINAANLLKDYYNVGNESLRLAIIYSLYRVNNRDAFDMFVKAIQDDDVWVRYYGAKGLGMTGREESLPFLYLHMHDSNRMVTIAVIEALGKIKGVDLKKVNHFKKSKNRDIRTQLAISLANMFGDESISILEDLLRDKSQMVAMAAIDSLSKINKEKALKYIKKNYKNKSYLKRMGIAKALGNIITEESLSLLLEMVNDKDIRVKEIALESLGNFEDDRIKKLYSECIDDSDYVVRAICAENLVKYADNSYIEKYKEVFKKAVMEGDQEGQQIILKAIVKIDEDIAKELLLSTLHSEYKVIRLLSAEILKEKYGIEEYNEVYKAVVSKKKGIYTSMLSYKGSPLVYMITNKGNIVIRLNGEEAPLHTANMINLAKAGFYNNLTFHRVVPGFVVQGGDPRGDGWGTAGIVLPDEISRLKFRAGSVGMPLAGKDTGGCQFFITLTPQPRLDYNYTLFGEVEQGMSVVEEIEVGDIIKKVLVID